MSLQQNFITILLAIFASSGFWTFITLFFERRSKRHDANEKAILALLHDRIYQSARTYLYRGEITLEELNNLRHLYEPYHERGGNGTGTELFERCTELPIKKLYKDKA